MNENLKDQEVLLVAEKGSSNKLQAVTGINENGTPKTAKPVQENEPEFLKIDKHGNALENFMSNFLRQSKDPTHFHFFKVPMAVIDKMIPTLEKMLKNPDNPENKQKLDEYRILPEAFSKKSYQAIDESRIDWSQFEQIGVTKDMIDEKALDKMLNWQKTPTLLPIKAEVGDMIIRTDARLSLRENTEGKLNLIVHAVRKEPQLEGFVYGVKLADDVKKNLAETGHAGKLVEIEPVRGSKMQAFLSVDKQTNELVAVRADKIRIPNEFKGVILSETQKKDLSEGKEVYIEGMRSKNDKIFNATIQVNADTRGFEFKFDNTHKQEQKQTEDKGQSQKQEQSQSDTPKFRIPNKLLGVELSTEQQEKLRTNQTIYVTGMTDKVGEKFNAYVKVNTEKGKLDFYKWNPDKAQKQGAEVTPDNKSKTQVAVNSEGKTNEATKDSKESLKQGQTQPTEKQVQKKEQKEEKQQVQKPKPRGIKR